MIIGSINEQSPAETRVALTPSTVSRLTKQGFSVLLENGFGQKAGFSDREFAAAGAELSGRPEEIYARSNILLQILPPEISLLNRLPAARIMAADFHDFDFSAFSGQAAIIRLEKVPRISVAQSIDIHSAQNTVRGYAAALFALAKAPFMTPQLMTAAASLKPAAALVAGAGVTGLQAASVFKHMGCRVTMLDTEQKAEELAHSVGADFIRSQPDTDFHALLSGKNLVLTAAASLNGAAPEIFTPKHLSALPSGSVVVDTTTGNVGLSAPEATAENYRFYRKTAMERTAPVTSSELWAGNMVNLIRLIAADGNSFNLSAEYLAPMLFRNNG